MDFKNQGKKAGFELHSHNTQMNAMTASPQQMAPGKPVAVE